jgi:hypothetical protein
VLRVGLCHSRQVAIMLSAMTSAPHRWHTFTGSHPLRVSTLHNPFTSASAGGFAGDGDADRGEHELDDQLDPVEAAGCSAIPQGEGQPKSRPAGWSRLGTRPR